MLIVVRLGGVRPVDRQLVVVRTDARTLCVRVREHAGHEHLVGADSDAGNQVAGREGCLLNLSEEVLRVAVERVVPDFHERVVRVRPRLSDVERVEAVGLCFVVGHDLHEDIPRGEVALVDSLEEIAAVVVSVGACELLRFLGAHVLDTEAGLEVVLDPEPLTLSVDPLVGVRTVAVEVTPRLRETAVSHEVGDLVGRLGRKSPEIPLHVRIAQTRSPEPLLRVDEVGELHGVTQKEDRRVVSDNVVVSLARVETK